MGKLTTISMEMDQFNETGFDIPLDVIGGWAKRLNELADDYKGTDRDTILNVSVTLESWYESDEPIPDYIVDALINHLDSI